MGVTGMAVNSAMGSVRSAANVASTTVSSAKSVGSSVSSITISRTTWYYFIVFLVLGCLMLTLAFCFLPMIVLAPQKFALLFTLGSLCILSSFSILRGHKEFFKYLFSR